MADSAWLIDLIKRVPIYIVDAHEADAAGDTTRANYGRAVERWREEAQLAVAEAEQLEGQRRCAVRRTPTKP